MHERLYFIDNLKSFALLLGPIFHTSIVYASEIGYVIKSEDTSYVFTFITFLIHIFRMPVFFFLSGFFCEMISDMAPWLSIVLNVKDTIYLQPSCFPWM